MLANTAIYNVVCNYFYGCLTWHVQYSVVRSYTCTYVLYIEWRKLLQSSQPAGSEQPHHSPFVHTGRYSYILFLMLVHIATYHAYTSIILYIASYV